MDTLSSDEARVLGSLIEKAMTTPAHYPLTLNALIAGCNQKSNREPVLTLDEDQVLDAIDGLRSKGFVREALLSGSRVTKYRHITREALDIEMTGVVLLAELMLRGPQSIGELRGRASRMLAFESTDDVRRALDALMSNDPPLVTEHPPAPGSRARKFSQEVCPGLHPVEAGAPAASHSSIQQELTHTAPVPSDLRKRVEQLERDVAELRTALARITSTVGIGDTSQESPR